MSEGTPRYRRYRGMSGKGQAAGGDPLQELRDLRAADGGQRSQQQQQQRAARREPIKPHRPQAPRRPIGRRIARLALRGAMAWVALSLVVFLVSAQLHQADIDGAGTAVLGNGGFPPVSPATVLVIGSDKRPSGSQEGGAQTTGYGLADSIMLMRVGGGSSSKLSIARDTLVPIPGHGVAKINSAYAYGGPALLTQTVEQWTGINVHHVMQISFDSFPDLIDAMGGITYKGSCVVSRINGGYKNGGVTVRVPGGKRTHLNGDQALGLARTRTNLSNPRENDLTRAHRQQKVLSSMKRRALSPIGFVRLPLIAWQLPRTLDSDMAGPRLLGTIAGLAIPGGSSRVLGTPSGQISDEVKLREVDRFLGR